MRRVTILLWLYCGLVAVVGTGVFCLQIHLFYRYHPDSVGPHPLPLLDETVLAQGYRRLPFVVAVLSALAAFRRRPLAYAGLLFVHLAFCLGPLPYLLLAWLLRTPTPRAVVLEQWGSVGLMAGALYVLTRPPVRAYFALEPQHVRQLCRYPAMVSLTYVALGFLL